MAFSSRIHPKLCKTESITHTKLTVVDHDLEKRSFQKHLIGNFPLILKFAEFLRDISGYLRNIIITKFTFIEYVKGKLPIETLLSYFDNSTHLIFLCIFVLCGHICVFMYISKKLGIPKFRMYF